MRLELEPTTSSMPHTEDAVSNAALKENDAAEALLALQDGIKAAQAGRRAQARALLLRAAELDPRSENAWLWLASISEYPEELLVFLSNVLEINPENHRAIEWTSATKSLLARTFVQRGIDAAQSGQKDFAVECFNKALEYDQLNSMAWMWMASLSDSNEGKIIYLEKVLDIEPDNNEATIALNNAKRAINEKLLSEARTAAVSGRAAEAIELVNAIAEITPDCEDAWILKAHLVDSFEEKIQCFERVIELNPNHRAAQAGRESLLAIVGTVVETAPTVPSSVSPFDSPADEPYFNTEVAPDKNPTQDLELPSVIEDKEAVFSTDALEAANDYEEDQPAQFTPEPNSPAAEETAEPVEETFVFGAEPTVDDFGCTEIDSAADIAGLEPAVEVTVVEPTPKTEDRSLSAEEVSLDNAEPVEYSNGHDIRLFPSYEPAVDYSHSFFNGVGSSNAHSDEPAQSSGSHLPDTFADSPKVDGFVADVSISEFVFDGPVEYSGDSEIPMPRVELALAPEPLRTGFETKLVDAQIDNTPSFFTGVCPFCHTEKESQAISCQSCMAVLTLSDLEMLLANQHADKAKVRQSVENMEREYGSRSMSGSEMTMLGIGHLNLRNLQSGYSYLLEASQLEPNNVLLSRQVNALLIRLEEIKIQDEAHDKMPKGKSIMVVDDSPTVRKLIAGKLEKCGHAVFACNDGVEAIDRLGEIVPDLVLLDITMPRMDGYQVCKSIRSNPATKDIPVVMISGKDGFFDKVRGRMAGTTGYITKPFGPETLMKAVEMYLKGEVPEVE